MHATVGVDVTERNKSAWTKPIRLIGVHKADQVCHWFPRLADELVGFLYADGTCSASATPNRTRRLPQRRGCNIIVKLQKHVLFLEINKINVLFKKIEPARPMCIGDQY